MKFLSNGDYIFPFGPALHWLEHLFVWSFQSGAPNLEGIIRLPVRLLNLIVFQIFGNLAVGYFYIIIAFIIIFFAFYYFSGAFLKVKSRLLRILGSLLFTFNPIFLGNLAKVGLIIAVAMLPLMFVAIKRGFETGKARYFLLYILLLNVSLVHPYTFMVNFLISGGYLLFLAWRHRHWILKAWPKLATVIGVGVLLNAYFILPILSVGSIDKSVLSQDLGSDPVDYTALVGIANTDDMLTAITLMKNVFLDFVFFNDAYRPFYFLGAFLLIGLLIGGYILAQKTLPRFQKKRILWCFTAILVLLILSTGTLFNIDAIIKFMIDLPGGWMFRSPLKWQLYIPIFMVSAIIIAIGYLSNKRLRYAAQGMMIAGLVLSSGFLVVDIYNRLLIPRQMTSFNAMNDINMEGRNLLFVTTDACMFYSQESPHIFTEFNQIVNSKNVQMKRASADQLEAVNLDSFDYVMSCVGSADEEVAKNDHIRKVQSFDEDGMELYENTVKRPLVYAVNDLFSLPQTTNLQAERQLVNDQFGKLFDYTDVNNDRISTGLFELFGGLNAQSVKDDELSTTIIPNNGGTQHVLMLNDQKLYYKNDDQKITLTPDKKVGFKPLPSNKKMLGIRADAGSNLEFRYQDSKFDYQNLIPNPSFEAGLWQKQVTDCNNFDQRPIIDMQEDKSSASDGYRSLKLEAQRHIACTGPAQEFKVKPGDRYLLSFDYKSSTSKRAGYFVGFNDDDQTFVSQRLPDPDNSWRSFSKIIKIPKGVSALTLLVYSYPDYTSGQNSVVGYDNFYLTKVPDIGAKYFALSPPSQKISQPKDVESEMLSPTARTVSVKNATGPFYLAMKDTFHSQWRISLNNSKLNAGINAWAPGAYGDAVPDKDHFVINGSMNGWYVDPSKLCQSTEGCTKNPDGSYNIELLIEFTPQRWLYGGLILSGLTAVGTIGYFMYDRRRHQRDRL